ncbi:hypothetical protein ACFSM5_15785 [Lacibacterium aquatile]|uniref:Tail fiber assembly protein n=1 Tax=Lacibacterium aquatile TaxID=1168082 RepID=A0ABW5DU43_9PROT
MTVYYSAETGGFYVPEIHGDAIPPNAVMITRTEHAALLDGQSAGQQIMSDEDGRPILVDRPPPVLELVKARALRQIDWDAEQYRLTLVTPGSAQAMVYLAKEDEARRFVLDSAPDAENYPLLAAEVGVTAEDLPGVAAQVATLASAWRQAAAGIETIRLAGKKAVQEAENAASVEAVLAALAFPSAS